MANGSTGVAAPKTTMTDRAQATPEELLRRARALTPVVRERAPRAEELRRLPAETIRDFVDAGFVRACVPERFGGMGHEVDIAAEIALEVARGCGASGWLSSFYTSHPFMLGYLPERALAEVWQDSPDVLISTLPGFTMDSYEWVNGGMRVSGQFRFSSGILDSQWCLVMLREAIAIVPRADLTVLDDWYVEGLKATGSNGAVADNLFIPAHRIATTASIVNGEHHGVETGDSIYYRARYAFAHISNQFILAPLIGMAQGVLDRFEERVVKRMDSQTGQPAHQRPNAQLRFAESEAEVEVARMLLRQNLAELRSWGELDRAPTLADRAHVRRNIVYAVRLCVQAVNRLVDNLDTSGASISAGMHRHARDFRVGATHLTLQWDETAMQYSAVRWGLEPQTFLI